MSDAAVKKQVWLLGEMSGRPCMLCGGRCQERVVKITVTINSTFLHDGWKLVEKCGKCGSERAVSPCRANFLRGLVGDHPVEAAVTTQVLRRGDWSASRCACGGRCRELLVEVTITHNNRVIHRACKVVEVCRRCSAERPVSRGKLVELMAASARG